MSKQLPYPSERITYMKKKNYFHEKKYLFSRQEIFIFMKINIFLHEKNSEVSGFLHTNNNIKSREKPSFLPFVMLYLRIEKKVFPTITHKQ